MEISLQARLTAKQILAEHGRNATSLEQSVKQENRVKELIQHALDAHAKSSVHLLSCRAMKALAGLTPGGSEYVDEPERCVALLKSRLDSGEEAKKQLVLLKRVVNWVLSDATYKAPEAVGVAGWRWIGKLKETIDELEARNATPANP